MSIPTSKHSTSEDSVLLKHNYLPPVPNANDAFVFARARYNEFKNKNPNAPFYTRDPAHPDTGITIERTTIQGRLAINLQDLPVVQRLKGVQQLSALYYAFFGAEHTRFPHSLGSAYLAIRALSHLESTVNQDRVYEVKKYAPAIVAAAMLHDVGHIAPRSHLAEQVWFPGKSDEHEKLSRRLIENDPGIQFVLRHKDVNSTTLVEDVLAIISHSKDIPAWTWMLVAGGGWNVDRGDFLKRDSVSCGVQYGLYDIEPLIRALTIAPDGKLAITRKGLDPLLSFFRARHEMYQQVYSHDLGRVGGELYKLVIKRARELYQQGKPLFANPTMKAALAASESSDLALKDVVLMDEGWWDVHIAAWCNNSDSILNDLSYRVKNRLIFKHFEYDPDLAKYLGELVKRSKLNPKYYILDIPERKIEFKKDLKDALVVVERGGNVKTLLQACSDYKVNLRREVYLKPRLLAVPVEVFKHHLPS